ncbi:MAG: c-type cytochrome [Lishizhenia sp.]
MNKLNYILTLILVGLVSWSLFSSSSVVKEKYKVISDQIGLSDLLKTLGDTASRNPIEKLNLDLATIGEQLIFKGKASYNGEKGKRISSYFVCTDCHNIQKEYPTLTGVDPQERLDYSVERDIPFLPGSSFFGIYNREKFYTKDYTRKYGELINNAKDTLENAIQVCAKYCSSGRFLKDWEEEAILHYFKKNELRLSDLRLTNREQSKLNDVITGGSDEEKRKIISLLKERYTLYYTATFLETKDRNKRTYGENGDIENGKKIYEKSCLYCHDNGRVTYLDLDKDELSASLLWKHRKDYSDLSPYQIIRHGTYPITGRKQYMPLYPKEKMSEKQVEDLVAYIKKIAKK